MEARHPEVFGEWLDEAIENIKPTMIIAVGATAASCGSAAKVTRERGRFFESTLAPLLSVTVHPSSILRTADSAARRFARSRFIKDLKTFARKLDRMR